ncbi:hypothetical protein ACFL1U_01500 [Patescibacteria group bacterium]
MNQIIIGCPYDRIIDLKSALKTIAKGSVIVDVNDVSAVDFDAIYVGSDFKPMRISDFNASFIRYPYDLIPPHTSNYSRREKTELLKTLALLFSDVSINKFSESLRARNRIYSLKVAASCGLNIPSSLIVSRNIGNFKTDLFSDKVVTKSLGNCYYAKRLNNEEELTKKQLFFTKDGNDSAYIYPAHAIKNAEELNAHIESFQVSFLQNCVKGKEFRIYLIGEKIFFYSREKVDGIDKSAGKKVPIDSPIDNKEKVKLFTLLKKLKLQYLNIDAVIDSATKKFIVIDINPFGSLPDYDTDPEPTLELARLILKDKKK